MEYPQAKLKTNGDKASPCFKPFYRYSNIPYWERFKLWLCSFIFLYLTIHLLLESVLILFPLQFFHMRAVARIMSVFIVYWKKVHIKNTYILSNWRHSVTFIQHLLYNPHIATSTVRAYPFSVGTFKTQFILWCGKVFLQVI